MKTKNHNRIVIITPRHVCYNPRVVKEADALATAGYEVTVVALCNHPKFAKLDANLICDRPWRLLTVKSRRRGGTYAEKIRWFRMAARNRFFQVLDIFLGIPKFSEYAQGREVPELRRLATSLPARLYIAHHPEALRAASSAAVRNEGSFAFDAEDFHSGMDGRRVPESVWRDKKDLSAGVDAILDWHASLPKLPEQRRIELLERKYLPKCAFVTAASDGIAFALQRKYGIERPTTIRNVFPFEPRERDRSTFNVQRSTPIKLYWYSQVIGPGRGLEEAVDALGLTPDGVELHLRGDSQGNFAHELRSRARKANAGGRLHFHPPCKPGELVWEAAHFDIGLALETDREVNRLLCETNKIFTYLNAGLAVVASDTPAQAEITRRLPEAIKLCRARDVLSLSKTLNSWLEEPNVLLLARKFARLNSEERLNWEVESEKFLELVQSSIRSRRSVPA